VSRVAIVAMSRAEFGGTFQYTFSMIDALKRIAHNEYTIFTDANNRSYDGCGLPVVAVPSAGKAIFAFALTRLFHSRRSGIFGDVDVLIAPIYTTYLLATRLPFVFTLHDLQERYFPENFSLAQRLWRGVSNWALSHAAAGIICESDHVKHDIERFLKIAGSKVAVIPAPPVTGLSRDAAASPAARSGMAASRVPRTYIFYPAQFFPHKNHLRLVEAFGMVLAEYPDCSLVLTGKARYEFNVVMSKVIELGLEDRVIHMGYVSTEVLSALYVDAQFVVIPTLFESISIPVYEAFRLGVAVCASNVVALPEQIGDAGLLFDPYSVTDMAAKMLLLLENPARRAELIRNGKLKIGRLTRDLYAAQLSELLEKLSAAAL
jgi:glycosyltransferase involved in cell wall biosynthesis